MTTWRRFHALLTGLSFESRFMQALQSEASEEPIITDQAAGIAYIKAQAKR